MKRPDVAIDNHTVVYDYYTSHTQGKYALALAGAAFYLMQRPSVHYETPETPETITALAHDPAASFLISVNHVSRQDHFPLAAAAWHSPLRGELGRTRVVAKDGLFHGPLRPVIDRMGAVPAFRTKNHPKTLTEPAARELSELGARRLANGENIALFPEATVNVEDATKVQPFRPGIGHIARRALELGANPYLLSIGLYGGPAGSHRAASVVIGGPKSIAALTPSGAAHDIAAVARHNLQQQVSRAVDYYDL